MAAHIMNASVNKYFDVTPTGRIYKILTDSVGNVQGWLPICIVIIFYVFFEIFTNLMLVAEASPKLVLLVPVFAMIGYHFVSQF